MNSEGAVNKSVLYRSGDIRDTLPRYQASLRNSRKTILSLILVVSLLAFELFNFDTTRYALHYLLGDVSFWGLRWATILAIAFCSIDFAGLSHLFTPQQNREASQAAWFLTGAWLLGATMNALMTWWAISLTLLSHEFGNEILSREALLKIVPVFVAALVWLTRILFIGALSIAGEHLFVQAERNTRNKVKPAHHKIQSRKPPMRNSDLVPAKESSGTNTNPSYRQKPPQSAAGRSTGETFISPLLDHVRLDQQRPVYVPKGAAQGRDPSLAG